MQAPTAQHSLRASPDRTGSEARRRILAAARILLRDRGYGGFSMLALAQASSLSRQTLYAHFAGRDQVYRASRQALAKSLAAALPSPPTFPGDPVCGLERFVAAALPFLASDEHVELWRSACADAASCPWVGGLYEKAVAAPLARLAEPHIRGVAQLRARTGEQGRARELIAMIRAAARPAPQSPAFVPTELTALFLRRLEAAPAAARAA